MQRTRTWTRFILWTISASNRLHIPASNYSTNFYCTVLSTLTRLLNDMLNFWALKFHWNRAAKAVYPWAGVRRNISGKWGWSRAVDFCKQRHFEQVRKQLRQRHGITFCIRHYNEESVHKVCPFHLPSKQATDKWPDMRSEVFQALWSLPPPPPPPLFLFIPTPHVTSSVAKFTLASVKFTSLIPSKLTSSVM